MAAGCRRICVQCVTGGGKTLTASKLIQEYVDHGKKVALYANRRLLIEQLSGVLGRHDIAHGIQSAEYEPAFHHQVQIASVQTMQARAIKGSRWSLHDADLIVQDELHLNSTEKCLEMQRRHLQKPGSVYVGFTATPIGIERMVDKLIVAGTKKECRDCGALVVAKHFGIDEPDMSGFRPNVKTGEYQEGDVVKAIMSKNVFGRVFEHWDTHNPDRKPSLLFAPGVKESVWFAKQFRVKGVRAAHIDGSECWLDGETYPSSKEVREQILSDFRKGHITVISNRYILREALDLPMVEFLILATVIGSLTACLQVYGRGLRASPSTGKTHLSILDHGGHWHSHGSANADVQWELGQTEASIKSERAERLREKKDPEPISCAKCHGVRSTGSVCPHCGFKSDKRSRMVVQQDGSLVEHHGDIYRPRKISDEPQAFKDWKSTYWRARKSGMTFNQAFALFAREHGWAYPAAEMPLMPKFPVDHYKHVADVPFSRLVQSIRKQDDQPLFGEQ